MSVNTPKRPKTAYFPGIGYNDENDECPFGETAAAAINNVDYLPMGHSVWPWTHAVGSGYDEPTCANAVLSPSSCGSPDPSRNAQRVTTTMTPRTPSTSSSSIAGQSSIPASFPTPTTSSSMAEPGYGTTGSSGGRSAAEHNKRGRPRSESLTNLMIEGSTSPSSIKCKFCHRVFPREKSLAAHLRTHTGERPYVCDYPGCTKSFTQSGQMKTHQRLHTGERPFICAVPNCEQRFTHANRHCPVHVHSQLKRDDKFVVKMTPEQNEEVLLWLEKYRAEREDKSTPTRKTPQRNGSRSGGGGGGGGQSSGTTTPVSKGGSGGMSGETGRLLSTSSSSSAEKKENLPRTPQNQGNKNSSYLNYNDSNLVGVENGGADLNSSTSSNKWHHHHNHHTNDENECPVTPSTPSSNPYKSRKGLMVELDMNAGLAFSPLAPLKMKPQPKVIQWQEPLSQGEEEDDEEEEDDDDDADDHEDTENRPQNGRRYLTTEKHHQSKEASPLRNYFSPSKKAHRQNTLTLNPKKKWLREACMEDLARPLDQSSSVLGSPQKLQIKSLNLLRPTVLMLASSKESAAPTPLLNGGGTKEATVAREVVPEGGVREAAASSSEVVVAQQQQPVAEIQTQNRKWLGAMALMQLATEEAAAVANLINGHVNGTGTGTVQMVGVNGGGGGGGGTSNGGHMPEYTQL